MAWVMGEVWDLVYVTKGADYKRESTVYTVTLSMHAMFEGEKRKEPEKEN